MPFISDARRSSVHPRSLITFFRFIEFILYNNRCKVSI
nr:MAG TPA: hypothetical protein [Caudoviricetes sp.]DAX88015.1 MAG TPA: hypothetical protein [Caudoviricetes sp.]